MIVIRHCNLHRGNEWHLIYWAASDLTMNPKQIQKHFCKHPPNSSISNPKSFASLLSADKDVWLMERHFDFEILIQAYLYSCAWPEQQSLIFGELYNVVGPIYS